MRCIGGSVMGRERRHEEVKGEGDGVVCPHGDFGGDPLCKLLGSARLP